MENDKERGRLTGDAWKAGETFFRESGGRPAKGAGGAGLPASEAGTGIIPEDKGEEGDTHLPASEADTGTFEDTGAAEPHSWPGNGGPGTFPPPG